MMTPEKVGLAIAIGAALPLVTWIIVGAAEAAFDAVKGAVTSLVRRG